MKIEFKTQPAPTIPDHIREALEEMSPRVFLRWDPKYEQIGTMEDGSPKWGGRWEIWCELRYSAHPDATNERAEGDRWNHEAQCWMRKLQVYKDRDGGYAGADQGLVTGLRMADAWADREFYDKHFDTAQERRAARLDAFQSLFRERGRYYHGLDNAIVGPYTKGNWRHRIR